MGKIFEHFQDPDWIFSVIVLGLLFAVVGGFAKDVILWFVSKFSLRIRRNRVKKKWLVRKQMLRMSISQNYLIAKSFQVVGFWILFLTSYMLVLSMVELNNIDYLNPQTNKIPTSLIETISDILIMLTFQIAAYYAFNVSSKFVRMNFYISYRMRANGLSKKKFRKKLKMKADR